MTGTAKSDAGSMTTATCPACGLSFETTATTNTRCRRCRKVVNIGRSRGAARVKRYEATSQEETPYEDYEPAPGGGGWGVLALLAGGALAVWLGSRSAKVPGAAPAEMVVPEQPKVPPGFGV